MLVVPASETEPRTVHLHLGDQWVSSTDRIVTLLGSCVAACLLDPAAGLGGMNHFGLPERPPNGVRAPGRYAPTAMAALLDAVLRAGAREARLQAKLFGAGSVLDGVSSALPMSNARAALDFLDRHGIPVVAQDTGGSRGRRIELAPRTGRVRVQLVAGRGSVA